MQTKKPFANPIEGSKFMHCFLKELEEKVEVARSVFVSKENVLQFNHGTNWQSHNSSNPENVSTLRSIQNEFTFKKSDFVNYKIDTLQDTLNSMADSLIESFNIEMYSTISNACDENGQTIDGSKMSPVDSFLEMLERIEFGVDRDGNPTKPTIHLGPGGIDTFKNDPKFNSPEIQIKVDKIIERKQREAIDRELSRLAKFKANND